jgi:hypothetical protein
VKSKFADISDFAEDDADDEDDLEGTNYLVRN